MVINCWINLAMLAGAAGRRCCTVTRYLLIKLTRESNLHMSFRSAIRPIFCSEISYVVVYRSPYSSEHRVPTSVFFAEFFSYLESLLLYKEPQLICGDFNIHVYSADDDDEVGFRDMPNMLNYGSTFAMLHTLMATRLISSSRVLRTISSIDSIGSLMTIVSHLNMPPLFVILHLLSP